MAGGEDVAMDKKAGSLPLTSRYSFLIHKKPCRRYFFSFDGVNLYFFAAL